MNEKRKAKRIQFTYEFSISEEKIDLKGVINLCLNKTKNREGTTP